MKNNIAYIALLLLISSLFTFCNTNGVKNTATPPPAHTGKKEEQYPPEVTKLGLQKEYDNTKWTLYCIHCDDICRFADSLHIPDTLTFASLDLKLHSITRNSSMGGVELDFYFYYNDMKCDLNTMRNKEIANGIMYQVDTGYVITYASLSRDHSMLSSKLTSRYLQPIQPAVTRYIQQNEGKLNSWFRNEAIKRKVLASTLPAVSK